MLSMFRSMRASTSSGLHLIPTTGGSSAPLPTCLRGEFEPLEVAPDAQSGDRCPELPLGDERFRVGEPRLGDARLGGDRFEKQEAILVITEEIEHAIGNT